MENQLKDSLDIETEEFPDEFQCCICLDLLYKPVVLACGHIACFWCIFKAMNTWHESHCPICRHPYNHFPSVCQLLHFLLLKVCPLAYEHRERQVTEEEKRIGSSSPQFDEYLSVSHPSKESNHVGGFYPHSTAPQNKKHLESCSSGEGEPSLIKELETVVRAVADKDNPLVIPTKSSNVAVRDVAAQENRMSGNKPVRGTCNRLLISDLLCAVCKQLLCRPVVLNCGHVFCETCTINSSDEVCRCQVCESLHPNGFPKVCLILEHFLEEHFSEEYAARKEAVRKVLQHESPPACSTAQSQQDAAWILSRPASAYLSWLSGHSQGPKVHIFVGCDFCGMWPIIGERYQCKDCTERMGFDLCEGCYNSSSKLPGRFNQQHTPEHKFEIAQPTRVDIIRSRPEAELSDEDVSGPEDPEDLSYALASSVVTPVDPEDGSAARDHESSNSAS